MKPRRVYRYGRARKRSHRHVHALVTACGVLAVVLLGAVVFKARTIDRPATPVLADYTENALEARVIGELYDFGDWLRANNAAGFIGELGWPNTGDIGKWNNLAAKWYRAADSYDVWTTAWAGGSWWQEYPLTIYGHQGGEQGLNVAYPQAAVVERHAANVYGDRRGINLAGMEFGAVVPGVAGTDYFYEPKESFAYLEQRGIRLVRLPLRWERIQPELNGPLHDAELAAIRTMLDAAHTQGISIILDLHNYGRYTEDGKEYILGDGHLMHEHLANVWIRLHRVFQDHPAVRGYGIMNEPHDLPDGGYASPAKNWEAASQRVVDSLRAGGARKLVLVAGYDWSSLGRWTRNHPQAWIIDPGHSIRYEAHHYWDADGSGRYAASYDEEVQQAR